MREILFRGKRKDNGEWVYGYYLPWHSVTDLQGNEPYAQIFEEHKVRGKYVAKGWAMVKFNTVGQFTGLYDSDGNKIFEGDVLAFDGAENKWEERATVVFDDGKFKLKYFKYTYLDDLDANTAECQSIIGDIYTDKGEMEK